MTMRKTIKPKQPHLILAILCLLFLSGFLESERGILASVPALDAEYPVSGDGTLRRLHVPVLMYHYVGQLPADADPTRVNLTVTPGQFQNHMQYLQSQGYVSVSLYEVHTALHTGAQLPEKPVVLTFDDGHLDHYQTVLPILQATGFTGTFFIITQFADTNRPGYMSWQQIQAMAQAGMHIEAHTKTHPDLSGRDYDYLVYQIMGSLESIAHFTGTMPRIFSYPAGRYDAQTLAVLQTTPVLQAVTTQHGALHTNTSRLEMPRLRITNETSVTGLAYLLRTQMP